MLGVSVAMPLAINASESQPRPMHGLRMMQAEADGGGGADIPFTPGMIRYEATVQAAFELAE